MTSDNSQREVWGAPDGKDFNIFFLYKTLEKRNVLSIEVWKIENYKENKNKTYPTPQRESLLPMCVSVFGGRVHRQYFYEHFLY